MLIKQIFELIGPGPSGRKCTPITGCFHDKTIISTVNIRLDCYFTAKILQKAKHFTSPTWAKSQTKFNPNLSYKI